MIRGVVFLLLLPAMAQAELHPVPYEDLTALPHRMEGFETVPPTPEPGLAFARHWRAPGISIGERLQGQTLSETVTPDGVFDSLTGTATAPLHVLPGRADQNFSVAQHRGFGSNALFPTGPKGQQLEGRGEGSLAMAFDTPQFAFGLLIHAEYADPMGTRPNPGVVFVTAYDPSGTQIARRAVTLTRGVIPLAWRSTGPVGAITIETTDPGGVAVDDILFDITAILG